MDAVESLMRIMLAHADVYLPIWGFSLFSIMRSFLQGCGLPTSCILYLMAPQGYGKTTAAKRLCQLFNDSNGMIADVYDAGSSAASIRNILMQARDRSVLFDDVFIGTNKVKQRERRDTAATLLRFAANETPLTKMVGTHEMSVSCAASLIVTGEIPLEASSDVTRCIIVRIPAPLTDTTDELRNVAATAMQGFLDWFAARYTEFHSKIQNDFNTFLIKRGSNREIRVQKSLFELHWLLCRFFEFSIDVGAVHSEDYKTLLPYAKQALAEVYRNIQRELYRINKRPPTLADAIVTGIRRKSLKRYEHCGCVCIRTDELTRYLRQIFNRSDLTDKQITSVLRQHNLLSLDRSGKSSKKSMASDFFIFQFHD